jgi:transcriptional regulator GlxA family with amidase domain
MTARAARRRVVEVVSEFLRNHAAEGVRIAEASRAVGVSERTLRNAFHHEHGISPKQFDLRERLRAARRALCEGSTRTVTEIATEFGFFELGRFSRIYRDAFGELPSQTIKANGLIMRRAS